MQARFVRKFETISQSGKYDQFLGNSFNYFRKGLPEIESKKQIQENYLKIASTEVERNNILVERLRKLKELIITKPAGVDPYQKLLKALKDLKIIFEDVYDEMIKLPEPKKPTETEKKFNLDEVLKFVHNEKDTISMLKSIINNEIESNESIKYKNKLFEEIKATIQDIDWREFGEELNQIPKICEYGSIVNSCSLKDSDLDVTIVTNNTVDERKLLKYVYDKGIKKYTNKADYKVEMILNQNIRYPLLDITKQGKFECKVSLTVNNILGVENSKLIETYMQISPKARILTLLVKIWAKIHKKSGGMKNLPTSYAYNLLVISFLQKTNPPILPSLQKLSKKEEWIEVKRTIRDEKQEFKTRIDFEKDLNILSAIMKKDYSSNNQNIIELLTSFFHFVCYGNPGNYEFSIRDAEWHEKFDPDNDYLFSLEDPFDLKHNPGRHLRMNSIQSKNVFDDMKKSIKLLSDRKIKEVFMPFD